MLIAKRMKLNPATADPDMNITSAANLMKKEGVHRLPVLDKNKKLVGVISEKNILLAMPSPVTTLSAFEMDYMVGELKVRDVMQKNPVTITPDFAVEDAARLMIDNDLSCLPVLDGERLVGIVSKSDMFKLLLELFGARQFGTRVEFLVEDKPGVILAISRDFSESGCNIISMGTFMGTDATTAICTMKVQGASAAQVAEILKPHVLEIYEVKEV